jgi:multidrug resistance efflux pump
MEMLLLLTYAAICAAIFKIFKIPLNKWTVPTAVLGGILIVGTLVVVMNYNHPYSESTRMYFQSVGIVPQVRGRVMEVPVQPNTVVKRGDVLFRIDDTPYRDTVKSLQARMAAAEDDRDHMKLELDRSQELERKGAASNRESQRWQAKYDGAVASIDDVKAQLHQAQFDLDSTVVRAPTDGMVTQLTLRPGTMVGRLNVNPVLVFLPTGESTLIGWFRQNSLLRLKPGSDAEVTFDALPGKVFSGKVRGVLPVIAEGQVLPTATLIEYKAQTASGRIPVIIDMDKSEFGEYDLPHGLFGQSAVYSEHAHHLAVMRKILLRMASWLDYLFPFH